MLLHFVNAKLKSNIIVS